MHLDRCAVGYGGQRAPLWVSSLLHLHTGSRARMEVPNLHGKLLYGGTLPQAPFNFIFAYVVLKWRLYCLQTAKFQEIHPPPPCFCLLTCGVRSVYPSLENPAFSSFPSSPEYCSFHLLLPTCVGWGQWSKLKTHFSHAGDAEMAEMWS